ncbi:MAG: GGDEF domain-containing protein [Planctomycetota bacterium]|nr:MAG: GGDEF domain-containing protein [Planctomycetota bacterium]
MNTGQFLVISQIGRRILPLLGLLAFAAGLGLALLMLWWVPLAMGGALLAACLAATPSAEDHLSHALRRRPDLSRLDRLAAEADLQSSVFDVATALVACVRVDECSRHFAAALRTYWRFSRCECWIWERGGWWRLGSDGRFEQPTASGVDSSLIEPPHLQGPVLLPSSEAGHLILDLSPGVAGQAVLILFDAHPQPTLQGHQPRDILALAEVLRAQLALALRRAMLHRELEGLARIDPLTSTDRRWYGERRLGELLHEEALVLAMADIDDFKLVNDSFGHLVGDQVLAQVGLAIRRHLRPHDLVFRYGGEEFVIAIRGVDPASGANALRRVVAAVAELPPAGPRVTLSIGMTVTTIGESPESAMARADSACYAAKRSGRNRLVVAENQDDSGA